jgi:hypothetical protein
MASRAEILRAGLGELPEATPSEERLLGAIAAMIAAGTAPKRRKGLDESKLAVSPKFLFEQVRDQAGDRVVCAPVDGGWFGRLGGVLKRMPDFGPADVQLLVEWLNAGGQASWPRGVPNFGDLVTHLPKWAGWAREWHNRGRQTLRGSTAVGTANNAESADFSAFAVRKLQ